MLGDHAIFVAGMPRAGSMWTYNVTRHLIRLNGMKPLPEILPPDDTRAADAALRTAPPPGSVHCVKTHAMLPVRRSDIRILCNFRDIRDAALSFMRFTRSTFEEALESARQAMKITDHYFSHTGTTVLPIDYDDILETPEIVIQRIAGFIEVNVSGAQAATIAAELSRDRIARKVALLSDRTGRTARIRNRDGSYRLCDPGSGFQTNHITSSASGEWRHAFTEEQKRQLQEVLGDWLRRYGY